MVDEVNWYRVIDPLSPLYGCDVRTAADPDLDGNDYVSIVAMRRIDIFVGDRPFQLVAPDGQNLGLLIDIRQLEPSPLQDDLIELVTNTPYGTCLDEYEVERGDGLRLHVATFELAAQVAVLKGGKVLRSVTCSVPTVPEHVRQLFEAGASTDDILEYMAVCSGEEAE